MNASVAKALRNEPLDNIDLFELASDLNKEEWIGPAALKLLEDEHLYWDLLEGQVDLDKGSDENNLQAARSVVQEIEAIQGTNPLLVAIEAQLPGGRRQTVLATRQPGRRYFEYIDPNEGDEGSESTLLTKAFYEKNHHVYLNGPQRHIELVGGVPTTMTSKPVIMSVIANMVLQKNPRPFESYKHVAKDFASRKGVEEMFKLSAMFRDETQKAARTGRDAKKTPPGNGGGGNNRPPLNGAVAGVAQNARGMSSADEWAVIMRNKAMPEATKPRRRTVTKAKGAKKPVKGGVKRQQRTMTPHAHLAAFQSFD